MNHPDTGLILYAHGARDPDWASPFIAVRERIAAERPDTMVTLAFLESMTPDLAGAVEALVARGIRRIVVAPLFWGRGRHLKQDLPAQLLAIQQARPAVELLLAPAAGDATALQAAMARWALDELEKFSGPA